MNAPTNASTPPPAPGNPAPIVGWIRRHKVISGIAGGFLALMILGGISNAAQSHKTNIQYVPVQQQSPQQSSQSSDLQRQIDQAQAQAQWRQQQREAQRQANDNRFEQGLGYAGSR